MGRVEASFSPYARVSQAGTAQRAIETRHAQAAHRSARATESASLASATATGRTQAKRVTRSARQTHAPEPQSVQGTGDARTLPGVPAMKPGLAQCATSAVAQGGIRLGGRLSVLGMGSVSAAIANASSRTSAQGAIAPGCPAHDKVCIATSLIICCMDTSPFALLHGGKQSPLVCFE